MDRSGMWRQGPFAGFLVNQYPDDVILFHNQIFDTQLLGGGTDVLLPVETTSDRGHGHTKGVA
jgi:hypothetical protein